MAAGEEGKDRDGKYWIAHAHEKKRNTDEPIVFIYRDPRDVIVSAKFYWAMKTWEQAIDGVTKGEWPYCRVWHEWIDYWLIGANADSVVTYEQLSNRPELHLSRILDDIGVQSIIPPEIAVNRQSFKNKRRHVDQHGGEMPYGKKFQNSLLRKGVVGDWVNHLTREHCMRIHERLWPYLKVLGYAEENQWYKQVLFRADSSIG